jgi:hypothetical protein
MSVDFEPICKGFKQDKKGNIFHEDGTPISDEMVALVKRARQDGMLFVSACLGAASVEMTNGKVNLVVPDILLCALPTIQVPLTKIIDRIVELCGAER